MGLPRHRSLQVTQRDAALCPRIPQRQAEHPFWGDRRIWAYLPFVEQPLVKKTRGLRLMREPDLLVTPNLKRNATRTPTRSQPRPTKLHE